MAPSKKDGRFTSKLFVVNRFRAGVLDDRKLDSIDFSLLQHGCEELVNAVPLIGGGVRRRPGVISAEIPVLPDAERESAIMRFWLGDSPCILQVWATAGEKKLNAKIYEYAPGDTPEDTPTLTAYDGNPLEIDDAFAAIVPDGFDAREIHLAQRESGDIILSHKDMRLLELRREAAGWTLEIMTLYNPPMEKFDGTRAEADADGYLVVEIPENSGRVYWQREDYQGGVWNDTAIGLDGEFDQTKLRGFYVRWDQVNSPQLVAFDEGNFAGYGRILDDDNDPGPANLFADLATEQADFVQGDWIGRSEAFTAGRLQARRAAVAALGDNQIPTGEFEYKAIDHANEPTFNMQAKVSYIDLNTISEENKEKLSFHIGTSLPPGIYRLRIGGTVGQPTKAEYHGDALHLAIGGRLYRSFVGFPNDFTQNRARVIPISGAGSPSVDYAGAGDVEADFGTLHYLPQGERIVNIISYTELVVQTDRGTYRVLGSSSGVAADRVNSGIALQYRFGQREGMDSLVMENSLVGFDDKKGRLYYTGFSGLEVGFRAVDLGSMRNSKIMRNTRRMAPLYIPDAANVVVGLRDDGTAWAMTFHSSELSAESSVFAFSDWEFAEADGTDRTIRDICALDDDSLAVLFADGRLALLAAGNPESDNAPVEDGGEAVCVEFRAKIPRPFSVQVEEERRYYSPFTVSCVWVNGDFCRAKVDVSDENPNGDILLIKWGDSPMQADIPINFLGVDSKNFRGGCEFKAVKDQFVRADESYWRDDPRRSLVLKYSGDGKDNDAFAIYTLSFQGRTTAFPVI